MENEILKQREEDNKVVLNKVCGFLDVKMPILSSMNLNDNIRELCVVKLCKVLGLKCAYNYKNNLLDFFSAIIAQAVAEKLSLRLNIAGANYRFVKYNHVNLIQEVKLMLDDNNLDESFVDIFNFLERFKSLVFKFNN